MSNKKASQITRHEKILQRLNSGEFLSISNLSTEFGVGTKTLQRDFKRLTDGNYGVQRVGKEFCMAKKQVTSKDALNSIAIVDSILENLGEKIQYEAKKALSNIQKHLESPFYTRIDIEDVSSKIEIIDKLEIAISEHKTISFEYRRLNDLQSVRTYKKVQPYKIVIFDGFYYLFCKYKEYFPKFYLKEITNLVIEDNSFEYDYSLLNKIEKAHNIYFEPNNEPKEVTLFLNKYAKIYFERNPIKGQILKSYKDGTAEAMISITNDEEIYSILKRWIPHVKVIEPQEMQEKFNQKLLDYCSNV